MGLIMANVEMYLLADGKTKRYRARWRAPNGKPGSKSSFRKERDATAYGVKMENAKLKGEYVNPSDGRVTVGELGPTWVQNRAVLKSSSQKAGEIAWRVHVEPYWGSVRINTIVPTDVKTWIAKMVVDGKSVPVIERNFGCLAGIIDMAIDDGRLAVNKVRGCLLPDRVAKRKVFLNHEEIIRLANAAADGLDKDKGVLVVLLSFMGLRYGEAAALRVVDFDPARARMRIIDNAPTGLSKAEVGSTKGGKMRTAPVPDFLVQMLVDLCKTKAPQDLIFPGPDGEPLKQSHSTTGWFAYARERAGGLPYMTPHDLRHTAASQAVSSGANVKAVQKMLGHEKASETLDIYAELFDDDLTAVSDAMDLRWSAQSCAISVRF